MRESDRLSFDAVTQAMPIYALRAYQGVVDLIIDDYKNKRCIFPASIMPQEQQESILAQPDNRALTWIETLSNMTLALDREDVFNAVVLDGFVQMIISEIEAHRNPFSDKVAASVKDEDDDEDDGDLDVTMNDVFVNEAVRALVKVQYSDTSVLLDETFREPHDTMNRFVQNTMFMPETYDLLVQVCDLLQNQRNLHRKAQSTLRKAKRLDSLDKDMTQTYMELIMTLSHVIYTFGIARDDTSVTPVTAIKYAVAVFGVIDRFDAQHVAGRLRSCMMA